ncbi:MAG: S9 family peptidase [Phycisphaerales bacterium]
MRRRLIQLTATTAALLSLIASVAAGPPHASRPSRRDEPPLIARSILFGNPDRVRPQISPNGEYLSWIAPYDGALNIWVAPADDLDEARAITRERGRGVRVSFWAYTSRDLLYFQDQEGDENWRLFRVDLQTGESRRLTPEEATSARLQELSPDHPRSALVLLNDRDPQYHDLYRVDIESGERTLVLENDRFYGFETDDAFRLRFAKRMRPDGSIELVQPSGDDWMPWSIIPMEDTLTTRLIGFDRSGGRVFLLDSRDRNTAALTSIDLATNEVSLLAENARADIREVVRDPLTGSPIAAQADYTRSEWTIIDPSWTADFEYLDSIDEGELDLRSRSLDGRRWIVSYLRDDGPVRYYLYDRDDQNARLLFTSRAALEDTPLARMRTAVIEARDGLPLVVYWTIPRNHCRGRERRPFAPLPTVLLVHGGPWARDSWGYNPVHQWLANRGYAVVSVNFRGSTGFGKEFVNAGDREWAGKMHDDLIDTVNWAIEERIADPERIAIMGGSYGGYAALVGLTFTPDTFACAVDIVGPSNLVTLLDTIPPYWKPTLEVWAKRVGDPRTEDGRAFLQSRSPLNFVDRITKPLLIGQGANDPRVKRSESDQIVKALQAREVPVTYVLYPDEGHGFARPENRLSFFGVTEAFLARHLGGRFEPLGDAFEQSPAMVVEGAEEIPGLTDSPTRKMKR